ncbi:MAG: DUF3472 domain-containing protein [Phycisphaerales bacterium]|jgi:hypothetical protein|nr:DUF3472 domain-containing protein [Phycisphaerales bacterium]
MTHSSLCSFVLACLAAIAWPPASTPRALAPSSQPPVAPSGPDAPAPPAAAVPEFFLPAIAAFAKPDERGLRRDESGLRRWESREIVWYVSIARAGEFSVRVELGAAEPKTPEGEKQDGIASDGNKPDAASRKPEKDASKPAGTLSVLALDAAGNQSSATLKLDDSTKAVVDPNPGSPTPGLLTLCPLTISRAGYVRLTLRAEGIKDAGLLRGITLVGDAAKDARASDVERRNAASVHLNYPLERGEEVAWFYGEVRAITDPLHSYYEVLGFHRGYFGIQVNSPTERRIIFSVWDAGGEEHDRNKVSDDNRVKLLAKGEGVYAGDFGNEGTGGHSHLKYMWKTGETYKLLLGARVEGDATIYSAYFFFPERGDWGLIASFRAPRDGKRPHGLYAFNENFWGTNGDARRLCEFSNAWVRRVDGSWRELVEAKFTHDGHGKEQRRDYAAWAKGTGFILSNGGFIDRPTSTGDLSLGILPGPDEAKEFAGRYGEMVRREVGGTRPEVEVVHITDR